MRRWGEQERVTTMNAKYLLTVLLLSVLALYVSSCTESTRQLDEDTTTDSDADTGSDTDSDSDTDTDSDGDTDTDTDTDTDSDSDTDGEVEFSYIWIANTHQGTVSKIDTRTMVEEGRYLTGPGFNMQPSRTSVNLEGDVAVLNRTGGVTKIYAREHRCKDTDGAPGIQTSTDAFYYDWGDDECIAWHLPLTYDSQRAIAWTSGEKDPASGEIRNQKLWVTGYNGETTAVDVYLINGDTGAVEDQTTVPVSPQSGFWVTKQAYGGAVDRENNFWWTEALPGSAEWTLVRVRFSDLSVKTWQKPRRSYGMTVDSLGRPWMCGADEDTLVGYVQRFDPADETWTESEVADASPSLTVGHTGCMADGEGRLWFGAVLDGGGNALASVDVETLASTGVFPLPSTAPDYDFPRGISIDVDGYVWGVTYRFGSTDDGGENAYRLDPETGDYEVFTELSGAYTYSDMTGFALTSVSIPPV